MTTLPVTSSLSIIICPGIHDPELTKSFISSWLHADLSEDISAKVISPHHEIKPITLHPTPDILVAPTEGIFTLSGLHICQFLHDRLHNRLKSPVIFISFSAGVVGAIAAASTWQMMGGCIKAFIAIDGWGVPLWGDFPIHRLSHDYFTHWSSLCLGGGQDNFYAEPAVEHLTLWRSPQTVQGWWVNSTKFTPSVSPKYLTACEFLHLLLKRYEQK